MADPPTDSNAAPSTGPTDTHLKHPLSDPDGQRPLATNGGYEEDRYWSSGGGKGTKLAKNPKTKKWGVAKKKPSAPKPPPKKRPAIILGDKQIGAPDRKALEDAVNKWSIDGSGLGLGLKEQYVGLKICQEHADWCSQWALENTEWVGQIDGLGGYEQRLAEDGMFALFEGLQSGVGGMGRGRVRPGGSCFRSFAADTQVLMADGSTKRIEEIKVGDLVIATDPETRKHGPREVTHVWVHGDQLVDLKMANDTKITTTEDHPFWNHTDQQWQDAQHLDRGDLLLTATGGSVPVVGLLDTTKTWGAAYNLTVDDIHTYYVMAGKTPVLVHNDGGVVIPWGDPNAFDSNALRGMSAAEIEAAIPDTWERVPSARGGGIVYKDPDNFGRQIRVMPGYTAGNRPDALTHGPYVQVSQNGVKSKVPLAGNSTLGGGC